MRCLAQKLSQQTSQCTNDKGHTMQENNLRYYKARLGIELNFVFGTLTYGTGSAIRSILANIFCTLFFLGILGLSSEKLIGQ